MIEWSTARWPVSKLKDYGKNPRKFTEKGMADLKASLTRLGYIDPIAINSDGTIIGGHARKKLLNQLGLTEVDVRVPSRTLTKAEVEEACIRLNKNIAGEFDFDILANAFESTDLVEWGFTPEELCLGAEEAADGQPNDGALSQRFLVPPFSVLNAREGWWQERKRQWLALGIESEHGRADGLLEMSATIARLNPKAEKDGKGASIFDPVLCELAYRWFSPEGSTILDPFAGGSVRGVVASKLGRQYVGCELRSEQVEANRIQGAEICPDNTPVWHCGDSRLIDRHCKGVGADFLFSCPPYADLEVYSADPKDLSTLGYQEFVRAYREIIAKSCGLLKDDRFACFVVGEVRDKKGNYHDFVGDTVQAFRDAGLAYYNEAILVTAVGSLPIRVGKQFSTGRKLGKTHQNVLVFAKGDARKAARVCGDIEIDESLFAEAGDERQAG